MQESDADNCRIDDEGVLVLVRCLQDLKELRISGNNTSDEAVVHIARDAQPTTTIRVSNKGIDLGNNYISNLHIPSQRLASRLKGFSTQISLQIYLRKLTVLAS